MSVSHSSTTEQTAYEAFLRDHPGFAETVALDQLRAQEYGRLDAARHIYLDYTGAGLYAESQVREHLALLSSGVFGNPHSANPTSAATTTQYSKGARTQSCPVDGLPALSDCSVSSESDCAGVLGSGLSPDFSRR